MGHSFKGLVVVVRITDVKILGISKIPNNLSNYFNQNAIFFFTLNFNAFNLQYE
jgi:hypothetical protein